jgi:hypothetical protein
LDAHCERCENQDQRPPAYAGGRFQVFAAMVEAAPRGSKASKDIPDDAANNGWPHAVRGFRSEVQRAYEKRI